MKTTTEIIEFDVGSLEYHVEMSNGRAYRVEVQGYDGKILDRKNGEELRIKPHPEDFVFRNSVVDINGKFLNLKQMVSFSLLADHPKIVKYKLTIIKKLFRHPITIWEKLPDEN